MPLASVVKVMIQKTRSFRRNDEGKETLDGDMMLQARYAGVACWEEVGGARHTAAHYDRLSAAVP